MRVSTSTWFLCTRVYYRGWNTCTYWCPLVLHSIPMQYIVIFMLDKPHSLLLEAPALYPCVNQINHSVSCNRSKSGNARQRREADAHGGAASKRPRIVAAVPTLLRHFREAERQRYCELCSDHALRSVTGFVGREGFPDAERLPSLHRAGKSSR